MTMTVHECMTTHECNAGETMEAEAGFPMFSQIWWFLGSRQGLCFRGSGHGSGRIDDKKNLRL